MTAGGLLGRWLIWEAWRAKTGNCAAALALYRESLKIFQELEHKRGIARLLECCACSRRCNSKPERSLRLAGAAAALRQNIGAPLTPAEQVKLETILESAAAGADQHGARRRGWKVGTCRWSGRSKKCWRRRQPIAI